MALCYIKATPTTKLYDRLLKTNWEDKMEREGEKWGGGGGVWRWASMSDHVGDGTWTITLILAILIGTLNALTSIVLYHLEWP